MIQKNRFANPVDTRNKISITTGTTYRIIKACSLKCFSISFHFGSNPFRSHNPTNQNTGQKRDERHQETVTGVIHHIQQLRRRSVRQRKFEIQDIVSKTDQYRIRKNAMAMILPTPPIASKTFGKEIKIRLGPAAIPSFPRNTNTDGIINIPARNATPVSNSSI